MVTAAIMPLMLAGPAAAQIADRVGEANNRVSNADRDRVGRGSGVMGSQDRFAVDRYMQCRYDARWDDRDRRNDRYDDRYGNRRDDRDYDRRDDRYDDRRDDRFDGRADGRYDDRFENRYDDRWDRNGGSHDWSGPYASSYSRDCVVFTARIGSNPRYGNWSTYNRDLIRLRERLELQHVRWHRVHGWAPRNPGWVRAHRALHERLAREYDRYWTRR
jgi:hypothetical protein